MAQQTITIRIDDLTGEELGREGTTVTFGLDGTTYEIDLADKNAQDMRDVLGKYVGAARRVGKVSAHSTGRRSSSSGSGHRADREYTAAVRAWAQAHGHKVADRGRIPADVVEAYEAAGRNRGQTTIPEPAKQDATPKADTKAQGKADDKPKAAAPTTDKAKAPTPA
jgi:hypothetical protein